MSAKWIAIVGLGLLASQVGAEEDRPLGTQAEKASYAMGVEVAKAFQRQHVEVDADVLARGLRDALSGRKLLMNEEELRTAMSAAREERRRRIASSKADRKAAGEAFRAQNARREGVVTLASGIQYLVLQPGEGERPKEGDTVRYHYRGSTIDGRVLDSSYRRGKPVEVAIARAPPAWREVLKSMPVGSRWQLVVPPEAERAVRGRGRKRGVVGRDDTLVYEVELLGIEPRRAADKTAKR